MAISTVIASASVPSTRVLPVVASAVKPVVQVTKTTGKVVGASLAVVGGSVTAAAVYEGHLSKDECSVHAPLRVQQPLAQCCAQNAARGVASNILATSSNPIIPQDDAACRTCIVVGAGVVGVTTAYYLAKKGFDVTVLEGHKRPAEEASGLNAGWLKSSTVEPQSPLATVTNVIADTLAGLSPWIFFKLALYKFNGGLDWAGLRHYMGVIGSEGEPEPPAASTKEDDFSTNPELRAAAVMSAAYDRTHFVNWGLLLSDHFRFAYCFAAQALVELWQASFCWEERKKDVEIRSTSLNTLSQSSIRLFHAIADEEGIECSSRFGGPVHVHCEGSSCPLPQKGDEAPTVWDGARTRHELGYIRGGVASAGLAGASHLPDTDGVADCGRFVQELERVCKDRYNVKFRYGAEVRELQADDVEATGRLISTVQCSDGRRYSASFFVLANGAGVAYLAQAIVDKHCSRPSPVYVPICGVRGYSLTLSPGAIAQEYWEALSRWPAVRFDPSGLTLTAFPSDGGPKDPPVTALRLSSIFEVGAQRARSAPSSAMTFGGASPSAMANEDAISQNRCEQALRRKVSEAVPGFLDAAMEAKVNSALRPQTPDDLPIISGTRFPNLFVNTGHGNRGFLLACGSSDLVSDLVVNDSRTEEAKPFSLQRFARIKLHWRSAVASGSPSEATVDENDRRVGPMELMFKGPAQRPGQWLLW